MSATKQQRQQRSQWMTLPANTNWASTPQSIALPEIKFADEHHLLAHLIDLVDELAEARLDWITLLHGEWSIDLCNFNLLSDGKQAVFQNKEIRRADDLVSFIPQSHYQPVITAQQMHWIYTCCVHIVKLGRVRMVIDFKACDSHKNPIIFATNRLDWSPRKVLQHWFERRPAFDFNEFDTHRGLIVEAFSLC
ncbi:hypothetical protein H6F90_11785 [Trichocoleus sp. FACHB-591]|uniref:hypothetical protein n=1 Tax=Trichocoleus sp. FACHB-591 TaxID=2692872 RepID=UPI00168702F4|nr:hypothetical protein [Trichocoleus sp. FACHB-591]MBD2095829.1 hypothetical protein [Trichocoleus sp. FACHB-591]